MFRNFRRVEANRKSQRSKFSLKGRTLRYETMEGRLVLSASGFAGNECAPILDEPDLDMTVPSRVFSPGEEITFSFRATNIVTDLGEGATPTSEMRFILDPDVAADPDPDPTNPGTSPAGATLTRRSAAEDFWDFSWTPTETQIGTFGLSIIVTDRGGTGGPNGTDPIVPLSDVYTFEISVDNQPTIDLNGGDGGDQTGEGVDFGPVAYTEGDGAVRIVDTDLTIPFASNDEVVSATVTIDNPQAGDVETLSITAGALTVDTSTPGQLVLTTSDGNPVNKSVFEEALRTLSYENSSDDPIATQTISVVINDGNANSAAATSTVNITGVNDGPNLLPNTDITDAMVGVEHTFEVVAEDPDGGDLLVFQIQSGPADATIAPNAGQDTPKNTIQVERGNDGVFRATIAWTPTQADLDAGTVPFIVSVTDSVGLADDEPYSVTVTNQLPSPLADPETAPADAGDPFAVDEDNAREVGNILTNDEANDPDGDQLAVQTVSQTDGGAAVADPTNFETAKGALVTIDADGNVTYDPNGQFENLAAGTSDTDEFWYSVNDGRGGVSASMVQVTITIFGVNDAPEAITDDQNPNFRPEFTISEDAGDTPLDRALILAAATDIDDGDALSIAEAPADPTDNGDTLGAFTFTAADGGNPESLSFNPSQAVLNLGPNDSRTIDVMVSVEDQEGESTLVPIRIIVQGVNESPVANDDPGEADSFTTDEDTLLTVPTRGVLANDTDVDTDDATLLVDEFTYSDETMSAGNTITNEDGSELTVNADGSFTFNPGDDFDVLNVASDPLMVTFTYTVTDGSSSSNAAIVTIEVTGTNDPPVAGPVTLNAMEDGGPVNGNFAGTDVDGDDGLLSYGFTSLVPPAEGTFVNNNDGTFTYDPGDNFQELAEGQTQDVTINYRALDLALAEDTSGTVTVTVTGVNDAPEVDIEALAAEVGGNANNGTVEVDLVAGSTLMVDLSQFTTDIDGDDADITFNRVTNNLPGEAFRDTNLPVLSSDGQLSWTPDNDLPPGLYVIRVNAADLNLESSILDIEVNVTQLI